MNGKDILVGFGEIEETYISEAEQFRSSRIDWVARLLASAAAVFGVLFTGLLGCVVVVMIAVFSPNGGTAPGDYQNGTLCEGAQGVNGSSALEDLDEKTFRAQYFQTDGAALQEKPIVVISSAQELNAFCERNREELRMNDDSGFQQIMKAYDERFFEEQLLVIVVSRESDNLISRKVYGVYDNTRGRSEGDWIIAMRNISSKNDQGQKLRNYLAFLELQLSDGFGREDRFVVCELTENAEGQS